MFAKPNLKYWSFFFLLASLEGGFALYSLLTLPTDPTNSLIFGLSASRLLMVSALLGIVLFSAWLGFYAWHNSHWRDKYLSPEHFSKAYTTLNRLSLFIALFFSGVLFLLHYYDPEFFMPLFLRAKPLLSTITLIGFQLSLWLLFLRKGFNPKEFRKKENFKAAGIFFAILLVLFAFIALTRIGLIPDTAYWAEPGIAIQGWQFIIALILGFLTFLFSYHKFAQSEKSTDILIPLLIWGIAIAIWWSVPMEVLKSSFYAPFAYPFGKSLPYSDAGFYDYLSQGLLLGQGFIAQIPPRPLYIVFLTGLRALVGINNYDQIMLGQTILYALFPVVLYLIGKNLHSRAAGITIAFFGIFREWTNLLVSSQTRVSNSRMTLTDLPTALVLSLLALVVIYWLKQSQSLSGAMTKGKSADEGLPLISGGIFGMLLLLRTQTMLILPFIFLLSLLVFFPNWKNWLRVSMILIFGVALSISPWLTRNAQITGKFTFDDPKQLAVLASQYKLSGNLNNSEFDFENENLSDSLLSFALENPGFVANFIATHFIATEINGLLALPLIEPFYGFQEPLNIYWTSWDGHLRTANQLLLIFYLAIIALGIGATWRKWKWVGLIPLAFNLGYALSNGVARFSGWRYDFPADWVAYFYFGIGFVESLILLASLFNISPLPRSKDFSPSFQKRDFSLQKFLLYASLFLLIGFSPIILEKTIPVHFDSLSESERLARITAIIPEAESFAAQDDAEILLGRLIYPRFYLRGAGIASAHPWAAYDVQDYTRMGFILINETRTDVVFPTKKISSTFPNGVDVITLGCQKEGYLEARLIYVMDTEETLLSEKGFRFCNE